MNRREFLGRVAAVAGVALVPSLPPERDAFEVHSSWQDRSLRHSSYPRWRPEVLGPVAERPISEAEIFNLIRRIQGV